MSVNNQRRFVAAKVPYSWTWYNVIYISLFISMIREIYLNITRMLLAV